MNTSFQDDLTNKTLGCSEGQGFGGNSNPLYAKSGLKGHSGIDFACGYGSDIRSYVSGIVYDLFPVTTPASDGYTAIFMLCQTPLETFEFLVGHVSEINVSIGQAVNKGDIIGKEGNHGPVYSGNTQITLAMQAAGDHRGSHRHLQKRPVKPVRFTQPGKEYLQPHGGPYRSQDGFYYEYALQGNGYDGCVDWTLPLFNRDLWLGSSGYGVYLLQRALGLPPQSQTGFFGPVTLAAVRVFQANKNINPTMGYVGTLTRRYLNTLYSPI